MKHFLQWLLIGMLGASGYVFAAQPVIGVADFRNTSGAHWWRAGVGRELAGMVSNEMASTGKFKMVEREKLQSVMQEQDFAATGRIKQGTGAKIGELTGAQYLVMGTVTSYQENTDSTGGGISFGGISLGGKKKEAYIAVDLRVVDTTTGELEFVRSVEATSADKGFSLGLHKWGFGGNLQKEQKTPAGKAIRAVVMEITDYLGCAMVDKGSCMAEFDAKEERRREKTKGAISLD